MIEQAGGRRWTQNEADKQVDAALSFLRQANPTPQAASGLIALAHLVTHRDH
jgi:geranylgeranyl diphosphate synthase type I